MTDDDLAKRLHATFVAELEDQVRLLNAELIALESEPNAVERIRSLFRSAHAVKGAARVAGVPIVEQACHALESLFAKVRDGEAALTPADFELLFATTDALSDAHGRLRDGRPLEEGPLLALLPRLREAPSARPDQLPNRPADAGPDASTPAAEGAHESASHAVDDNAAAQMPAKQDETVRVRSEKLDTLSIVSGELVVATSGVVRQAAEWLDFRDELSRWAARHAARRRTGASNGSRSDPGDLEATLNRLVQRADAIARGAAARSSLLERATADVAGGVRRLRLRPLSDATERLPRAVRDIASRTGKRIALEIEGDDIEADRIVIDALREPLLHLVRNAADHGIELPAAREAAGKPPEGTIQLRASLQSGRLRVIVEDDGAGVDAKAVRAAIARRGGSPPADDRQLAWLLLDGGISTRDHATELSGRGVGLDLVRSSLEGIGGGVRMSWKRGRGTRFTLEAPPTPTAMRAVLVRVSGQLFAIPAMSVERLVHIRPEHVRELDGRPVLTLDDGPVALVSLAAVLGPPFVARPLSTVVPGIVLEAGEERAALTVEEVVDEGEIVVRPLDERASVPHVTGGALLATGRIALVLSTGSLTHAALRRRDAEPVVSEEPAAPVRRILVADDSITTRTLEQSVLEAAGFEVTAAVDGEDAWEKLVANGADLIVADIEMPRLDGYELSRRVRASKRFAETPIVLVTGLASAEDRARGLEAGADAYITKSSFDQTTLLDTIRRLVG